MEIYLDQEILGLTTYGCSKKLLVNYNLDECIFELIDERLEGNGVIVETMLLRPWNNSLRVMNDKAGLVALRTKLQIRIRL